MRCAQCGGEMDQIDKNTFTGREIREYLCRRCGFTDIVDEGEALWQILHNAREEAERQKPAPPPKPSIWKRCLRKLRRISTKN
jgi:hypothetical protein